VITDTGGVDTLVLPTAGNTDISGLNNGAAFLTAGNGLDRLIMDDGNTLTVAPGQITGAIPFNLLVGATSAVFTLGTAGSLDVSALDRTVGLSYTTAAGATATGLVGVVTTLNGSSGDDTIIGASAIAETITGGLGKDLITAGNGDAAVFALGSAATNATTLGTATLPSQVATVTSGTTALTTADVITMSSTTTGHTLRLDLAALNNSIGDGAITINTTAGNVMVGTTVNDIIISAGTFVSSTGIFTVTATSPTHTLVQTDVNSTTAGGVLNIVVVGVFATAASTTEILTLTV
jgi:hypothetical protein